jgi:(p)ppGpp synthase/HD superfamily hydrolase
MHAAQQRKGTHIPYVSHLLGTCAITFEYGGDEDEAIAALLHDAIEDIRPTAAARETVEAFGPRVLAIVEGCTDSDRHPKPPWRARKEAFLARLAGADRSVLLVASADKLHNARTLVADVRRVGDDVWKRFKADRESSIWYYETAVAVIRANPEHHPALVDELERTVRELAATTQGRTQGSSSEAAASGASEPS